MAWPVTQADNVKAFEEDKAWFENSYKCVECGTEWTDEWSCQCDDDCPECGTTMTPYESEDLEGPE